MSKSVSFGSLSVRLAPRSGGGFSSAAIRPSPISITRCTSSSAGMMPTSTALSFTTENMASPTSVDIHSPITPNTCALADLRLRLNARFLYEYDFGNQWEHELRLEHILPFDFCQSLPLLYKRQASHAPPEDCGGPEAFMALVRSFPLRGGSQARLAEIFLDETDTLLRDHHDGDTRTLILGKGRTLSPQGSSIVASPLYAAGDVRWMESAEETDNETAPPTRRRTGRQHTAGDRLRSVALSGKKISNSTRLALPLPKRRLFSLAYNKPSCMQQATAYHATQKTVFSLSYAVDPQRPAYTCHANAFRPNAPIQSPLLSVRLSAPRHPAVLVLLQHASTERTTPEMRYLEAKWAAQLSYDQTAALFADVLARSKPTPTTPRSYAIPNK